MTMNELLNADGNAGVCARAPGSSAAKPIVDTSLSVGLIPTSA